MTAGQPARLVVLISGRGSNFAALRSAIERGEVNARIATVISDRPQAAGLALARKHHIDSVCIDRQRCRDRDTFETALATAIDGHAPDFIVLAGFMRVLGDAFVERYPGRMVNIHPSLLPRHRGLNTHQRALDAGDRDHGASVHFVTPKLDSGPVISQARLEIQPDDTAETLADRLLKLEHQLLPATMALLSDQQVQWRDETIQINNQVLTEPLLLGRNLGPGGQLDDRRDDRRDNRR